MEKVTGVKPRINKILNLDYYTCKLPLQNWRYHGYGNTPREAYWHWHSKRDLVLDEKNRLIRAEGKVR